MSYSIPIIVGTSREGNKSQHAASFVKSQLEKHDTVSTELVRPEDFNLPGDGNDEGAKDPAFGKIAKEADAYIIVVPEYNHSFPGSLKRLIDSELGAYTHKPVALVGVSAGSFGGVRAIENLIPALREMGMVVTFTDMYVSKSYDRFNDAGELVLDAEMYAKNAQRMIEELLWMTKTLEYGRNSVSTPSS